MLRILIVLISALVSTVVTLAQGPSKALPPDAQIDAAVHDRLAKSIAGQDGFTVRVKDGVVYWEGSTTIAQHKGAATRMAKSSGARRVVNNIKVKKSSGGAPVPKTARTIPRPPPVSGPPPAKSPSPPDPLRQVTVKWRENHP